MHGPLGMPGSIPLGQTTGAAKNPGTGRATRSGSGSGMPQHTAKCERYAVPVVNPPAVVAEHTPNPHAIKFLLGRSFLDEPYDFDAPVPAAVSPLAARLFARPGVQRVFLGPDFVVITKDPGTGWPLLAPRVIETLREFLALEQPAVGPDARPARASAGGEEEERMARVLLEQIQPIVAAHGGDVELVGYAGGVARLVLRGACAGCPASEATLRSQIERRLRAEFPDLVRVEQA